MGHYFHLLVWVPHRPEGFDLPPEVVVARLERALGEESAMVMHRNLELWPTSKNAGPGPDRFRTLPLVTLRKAWPTTCQ